MDGPSARTNISAARAVLVGRVAERAAIAGRFDDGTHLVTLVGPGGVGKTRLATRIALDHAAAYSAHGGGGAWLVDLTEARSAMAMCAAVAAAIGLALDRDTSEPRVVAALGRALARRRRLLLVLDNCEHIAPIAAATIEAWLAAAPRVDVLATSRVPLGVPGEQLWPLAGLAVPTETQAVDEVRRSEAVELFLRRALQVRPGLRAPDDELLAIAEIVRRLDGMPLAIELAAGRLVALSPGQIRDRLALELLVRPGDTGRHGSMREVIASSVRALAPAERASFARCAIFRGGFTMRAAEAILDGDDVHGAIEVLCRHSLLRTTLGEDQREPRFYFVELLREVAIAELVGAPGERERIAARHAAYFASEARALGERAELHADPVALATLGAELENIVEAHAWAIATAGHTALALDLALGLDPLLAMRGMFRLRLRLLDEVIGAGGEGEPRAWIARGQAQRELGVLDRARTDLERGRALASAHADAELEAVAEIRIGELVEIDGATGAARAHYERALQRLALAPLGPRTELREAEAHAALGHAWRREGELVAADTAVARALARYRTAQHLPGIAAMSYEAAVVALFREDRGVARARLDEGLAIATTLAARQLEAAIRSGLGILLQEQGELEAAISQHVAAVQVFRNLGNRHRTGSALYYLGCAYLERGELAEAQTVLAQALAEIRAVGAMRYQVLIESARGAAHALGGERAEADEAFARAATAAVACQSEPALLATLAIHRLQLARSSDAIAEARRLVAATPGDDPRFAIAAPVRGALQAAALHVRPDGIAFRAPGGTVEVDLARRQPLRRLVAALAHQRMTAPGESLGFDELLAAGWPGERIHQAAAVNRVHVALTTLRKLGLRGVLVSGDHGYLFDPSVPLVVD